MERPNTTSVLETIDVHSGERTTLRHFDCVIEAPNWTSDGQRLIYNSGGMIFAYEFSTDAISKIETGIAIDCNNDHVLSPDGRELAISNFGAHDALSRIYILPVGGGEPRLVTDEGPSYLHGWSPDGKRLAYCAQRHDSYDIYTIDRSGGQEERLTSTPGLDDGPEYSPDGKYIWFNSTRSGLMQMWRMNVNGEQQKQVLHEDANCWFPHVSPDGKWIAYIAYAKGDVEPMDHPPNRHVELRIASTEGGPSRLLAKLFGGQGTMNVNSWSPDSTKLALVSYRTKA